jgi:alkylation response protein AidB-like acyl-CoA dehydrogenase
LQNSVGKLIGPLHKGVSVISTILNITRIHNAISSIAVMRRGIAVARDYTSRRQVFGKLLQDQPLHLTTLAEMEIQYRYLFMFYFRNNYLKQKKNYLR